MISKQTTLGLNGPILSFTQQPQSVSVCNGQSATFVGIATAFFPTQVPSNPAVNDGTLVYRWYDQNGPLFDDPPPSGGDGVTISGAGTTTLRLYNIRRTRTIFLTADYIPTAYGLPGVEINAGTARSTGNAVLDPLESQRVSLTINPDISINSSLVDQTTIPNRSSIFTVNATATDGNNSLISYQWQLNEQNLRDGTTVTGTFTGGASGNLTITDESNNSSTTINFSQLSVYSNFLTGRTYRLVTDADIAVNLSAFGAGGGASVERNASGGKGGSSTGTFTFIRNQIYRLIVGGAGVTGGVGGFGGGGNGGGGTGFGGGGGGYTGLFINSVSQSNAIIIAGGGGGGGNDPATGGAGGGLIAGNGGNAPSRGGTGGTQTSGGTGFATGTALQGGSGAGGGGGGYFGGGSGIPFNGCCADGAGGGGSSYIHPTLLTNSSTTLGGGSDQLVDGVFTIGVIGSTQQSTITVSGSNGSSLSIVSNSTGANRIRCRVSHPTACNSPLFTNSANFTVVYPRQIVNFERFDENTLYSKGSQNIADSSITLTGDSSITFLSYCIYASEEDVRVRITLAGGAGVSRSGFRGGQGGVSVLEYTLKQNVEYILKLGSGAPPTGGTNGGGGGAFLYEKARIIAVCGGGGGAGTSGRGGDGGGINVTGEIGQGNGAGAGGRTISAGTLPTTSGYDNSGTTGGQVSGCTIGNYYARLYTPCADVGQQQYRNGDGTIISGTATLLRGWKSGPAYRNNGGDGSGNQGGGGAGTYGGNAAILNGAGGGGGSGYTDGSITLISTQLGGNSATNAYAIIAKVN